MLNIVSFYEMEADFDIDLWTFKWLKRFLLCGRMVGVKFSVLLVTLMIFLALMWQLKLMLKAIDKSQPSVLENMLGCIEW